MQLIQAPPKMNIYNAQDVLPFIIPFQSVQKHFLEWNCPLETLQVDQVYYKYLEGDAQIIYKNGNRFSGQIHKGYYEGVGEFYWKNQEITYRGNFSKNKINGKGQFYYPDGSYYKGEVLNGFRHGFGQFYQSKSQGITIQKNQQSYTYIGQWSKNQRSGKGKINYENGASYDGQWKDDLRNGFGKMIYQTGNQYEGEWENDKKCGQGTMKWVSHHEKYKGKWFQDVPHGYGEYFWYDNKVEYKIIKNFYKGCWNRGKRQGFGAFYYANGCRFEGYFMNNAKNGYGLLIDQYGLIELNNYSNNRLDNPAIYKKTNNSKKLKRDSISLNRGESQKKLPKISKNKQSRKNSIQGYAPNKSSNKISFLNVPIENYYRKFIDFSHPAISDNFYNFLLRINTRLHHLYRNISSSSIQIKEEYSGMTLENYWKAVRESKILNLGISNNQSLISIADINRQFCKGTRSWYDISGKPSAIVLNHIISDGSLVDQNYSEIPWINLFQKIKRELPHQGQLQQGQISVQLPQNPIRNIHNNLQVILFRHFVCLVVHTGILLSAREVSQIKLKETIENILTQMEGIYDLNNSNQNTNNIKYDKVSVHDSHLTCQKHMSLPQWSEDIHKKFLSGLFEQRKNKKIFDVQDQTVSLKFLLYTLKKGKIFKDLSEEILFIQKIQRWLNLRSILSKKQIRNAYIAACMEEQINQKTANYLIHSPYFSQIMSYQLNYKEVKEIIFQIITRKITGSSSQQQFINKYTNFINNISSQTFSKQNSAITLKHKHKKTNKDIIRQNMVKDFERKKKQEQIRMKKLEQEKRQEIERTLMMREDRDASSIDDQASDQLLEDDYYM